MSDPGDVTFSIALSSDSDRYENNSSITTAGTDSGIRAVPVSEGLTIAEDGDDIEIEWTNYTTPSVVRRAIKAGRRSERLGLFLFTQNIAEPVSKQINTKVVLDLGDAEAISAVSLLANLAGKVPYMEKSRWSFARRIIPNPLGCRTVRQKTNRHSL